MNDFQDAVSDLYKDVCEHWNAAEKAVKRAEQLVGSAVIPAIFELRYAGRRMIEAQCLLRENTQESNDKALKRLQDASYNCQRAAHDAMDASVATISIHLRDLEKKLSPKKIVKAFPKYPDLLNALDAVQLRIQAARENREERNDIYANLGEEEFELLEVIYREFKKSPNVLKIARHSRWFALTGWILAVLILFLQTAFGIAIGEVWEYFKPDFLKPTIETASTLGAFAT